MGGVERQAVGHAAAAIVAGEGEGGVQQACTRFWCAEPGLTRDVFARLLKKCRTVPSLRGRKLNSVLDASEAAARKAHAASSPLSAEATAASSAFFGLVGEALLLGRKFTMMRLLELQGSATRRWS